MSSAAPLSNYQQQSNQEKQFRPAFNAEELRVLRECNRESFYFRCVPFATALSTAAYAAMRNGLLKTSGRFGYFPKMMAGAMLGYFAGKLSYQNACAEKLMQLPDSPIAEALRKRKGRLGFQETLGMEPGFSTADPSYTNKGPTDLTLYEDPRTDLRDQNEGLVDYERGVTQSLSEYTESEDGTGRSPQSYTTYHELRRQNRHEYLNKMADRYRKDKSTEPPVDGGTPHSLDEPSSLNSPSSSTPSYRPPPPPPPPYRKKNQYGDEIE